MDVLTYRDARYAMSASTQVSMSRSWLKKWVAIRSPSGFSVTAMLRSARKRTAPTRIVQGHEGGPRPVIPPGRQHLEVASLQA